MIQRGRGNGEGRRYGGVACTSLLLSLFKNHHAPPFLAFLEALPGGRPRFLGEAEAEEPAALEGATCGDAFGGRPRFLGEAEGEADFAAALTGDLVPLPADFAGDLERPRDAFCELDSSFSCRSG